MKINDDTSVAHAESHKCIIIAGFNRDDIFSGSFHQGSVLVEKATSENHKYFFSYFSEGIDFSKSFTNSGEKGRCNSCLIILDNGFAQEVTVVKNNSYASSDEKQIFVDRLEMISKSTPVMIPHVMD